MTKEDRFKSSEIATLAKRAANRCSNPDCGAITSGPTSDPTGSVNVGEAAHIFGANPGSARFDPKMSSAERSAIANGIWLCSTCHKLVDNDPTRYPAGLLFEWQRAHERLIAIQVGKAGAEVRWRYEKRHLEEFGRLSYLAERLILEKGDFWEYCLTAEVLRFEMAPVLQRWSALKRGLYVRPRTQLSRTDFVPWMQSRNSEATAIANALSELINFEFKRAWGDPGVPGNDREIVTTCRLLAETCQSALTWEETVRFTATDEVFEEVRALYEGVVGMIIDEASKLPLFLSETLGTTPAPGSYSLNLELSLPENWSENVSAAYAKARRKL